MRLRLVPLLWWWWLLLLMMLLLLPPMLLLLLLAVGPQVYPFFSLSLSLSVSPLLPVDVSSAFPHSRKAQTGAS